MRSISRVCDVSINTDTLMSMEELCGLMDAAAPKPGRPKTYKKKVVA